MLRPPVAPDVSGRSAHAPIRRRLASLSPSQRILVGFGLVTAATALFHGFVWLAAGAPALVGPVTWRKPIVFGASIAVLSCSLAWVVGHLRDTRSLRVQAWWFVGLLGAELALIDLQQWRGVASHFNSATALDAAIFSAMGAIIMGATIVVSWWTWLVWRSPRRDRPREQLLAARAGMLLLAAGNGIGIVLATWGSSLVAAAGGNLAAAESLAGLKLAHAVGLHGLQVLPLAAIALAYLPGEDIRVPTMRGVTTGYVLLLAWLLLQGWAGRTPDQLAWPSALLLVTAAAALVRALGMAAASITARLGSSAPIQDSK